MFFVRFRRRTYVTPKTFISFLGTYKTIYKQKVDEIGVMATRMRTGLKKLVEAQSSVDILRQELAVKEKEMTVASENAEKVCFILRYHLFGIDNICYKETLFNLFIIKIAEFKNINWKPV